MPPCPPLPITVTIPEDQEAAVDFLALPTKPGVFALEDETGGTLALAITANLRRLVKSRLQPKTEEEGPSRRVDYRQRARFVRAMTVGSAFEADWAYLQLAHRRIPHTFGHLLDRWRGWFIHCDPQAPFPRLLKTNSPGGAVGAIFGPVADKHAAQRVIELLERAFDLCRHFHILVDAPNATACAYKEMGQCPAPCDGSITMEAYRSLLADALEFLAQPVNEARAGIESRMRRSSGELDFEGADRWRHRLDATKLLTKPQYRFIDRLDRFRFLAVLPSERADYARLMAVAGGWIAPVLDLALDCGRAELDEVVFAAMQQMGDRIAIDSEAAVQNIGLVCRYLFRPKKDKVIGEFLPWREGVDRQVIKRSLQRLMKRAADTDVDGGEGAGDISDTLIHEIG